MTESMNIWWSGFAVGLSLASIIVSILTFTIFSVRTITKRE